MDLLNQFLAFVGGMHLSALIIIGLIVVIFLVAIIFSVTSRGMYAKLQKDLDRLVASGRAAVSTLAPAAAVPANAPATADDAARPDRPDRFSEPRTKDPLLRGIISDYESAWAGQDGGAVNTQAIIENRFNGKMKSWLLREQFTQHSVSIMIVLGLLGTFIGLTISVQSLVLLFRESDVTELLQSVESGLLSALAGMSTAFTTSLFGIACSVVVTFFNVFFNVGQARERVMTAIEEYLDNTAAARLRVYSGSAYEAMDGALRRTFIEFGEKIAERFDRSLQTFHGDIRGVEDANNNLRNTIEMMDACFVRVADAVKASTRHIEDNYQVLSGLSDGLAATRDAYEAGRRESAAHADRLAKSVADASDAICGLTADLRGEAQKRLDDFANYDAAISRMARSAELIRDAVAAIPEQMLAYSEAPGIPSGAASRRLAGGQRGEPQNERRFGNDSVGDGAGDGGDGGGWSTKV
ncbi:MAG: hypothetical protein LBU58_06905 [Clostridiales bacterium]|jgi:hypothetical protein|nr:hypothetical protein [Clostridiales bacterium]